MALKTNSLHGLEELSLSDRVLFKSFGIGFYSKSPFSTVHQAFESVVDSNPSLTAVEYDGQSISYGELDVAANVLANRLINLGLLPRQRVCLLSRRSIPMIISILAVLKCGCQVSEVYGSIFLFLADRFTYYC